MGPEEEGRGGDSERKVSDDFSKFQELCVKRAFGVDEEAVGDSVVSGYGKPLVLTMVRYLAYLDILEGVIARTRFERMGLREKVED